MAILLSVLLMVALVAVGVVVQRLRVAAGEADALRARVQGLSKYQQIIDADLAAQEIRASARREATEVGRVAHEQANRVVAEGTLAREQATVAAMNQVAAGSAEATRIMSDARQRSDEAAREAANFIDAAQRRAQEIAGEALQAVLDASRAEKTAEAMRNIIEGYGDRYVVPAAGLLDELAEEFGFAEAGRSLKTARDRTREMIKQGAAAACDYVEANRRSTAIAFVLDAFNGKVDTALADVRDDNVGTLRKKIQDAFALVNHNGEAFRNARITPEYLAARLEELRWATVAQELKLKEREEQRAIREQIREEEKAQREFERAAKEAEKEEDVIRKAMEKAQREIEKAGTEQKAKFEEQIRLLGEKLRLAEEKNKRALSMAQQTKSGHVYVISNVGSFGESVFKIGMTRRLEPLDRVRELGDASVPFEFDVHAMIPSDDAPALEKALHKRFVRHQVNKANPRKEFFRVTLHEVRTEADAMKVQVAWTLAAACKEYKETQAIEQAMANKTLDEKAWVGRQLTAADQHAMRGGDEAAEG
ncbi:MAG: DUF4041 domain-containing protein [Deltaproteobacteria bacterium]